MNSLTPAILGIFKRRQEEANPIESGDYLGEDGLIYCGNCNTRKQHRLTFDGQEMIVPCLCRCRELKEKELERQQKEKERQRQIELNRRQSMMVPTLQDARLSDYSIRKENERAYKIASSYVENFQMMLKGNQGLLLYGPVGTGKSYTAACIANELLDRGYSVIMTSFVRILADLRDMDEGELLQTLTRVSLLIIDDLGAERGTDYATEKVYNVIDSRVRAARPLILTTNLSLDYMKDPKDIRYTRIYDRIFENCYPVQITGRSFRLDEANRRFVQMRNLLEQKG